MLIMSQSDPNRFPHNQAYISPSSVSSRREPAQAGEVSASVLGERVQELQDQLAHIAAALNEQGRENQAWQEQLLAENRRVGELLVEREGQVASLREQLAMGEEEKRLLKSNLLKQNEEMQSLHKQLQQSRTEKSRVASAELQQKILEMNDQVSTLLVKIQQLIDQNNQHLNYQEDLKQAVDEYRAAYQVATGQIQKLMDENNYLKQQIKEVETQAITHQTETQDRYLQQLDEARVGLEHLKNQPRPAEPQQPVRTHSEQSDRQLGRLRAEVHSLEEELLQQRDIERGMKKKYEERLIAAQNQASALNQELSKMRIKGRQLQNACSQHCFALEQLQKEKERGGPTYVNDEQFRSIILRLQAEKEELSLKLSKSLAHQKYDKPNQFLSSAVEEAQIKVDLLREQLALAEQQLTRSRRSAREVGQLAKRWEQDYRRLSRQYQQALQARRSFEERVRVEQAELSKHKEIYEQLVKKYDRFQGLYSDLETKVRILQERKDIPPRSHSQHYDIESSALIKLQNSALKQEITQLKRSLQENNYQITSKVETANSYEIERGRLREKQLQRLVEGLRNRLAAQSNTSKEVYEEKKTYEGKIKELTEQLMRVNRLLNQRQVELDSLRERYAEVQSQLSKREDALAPSRHNPEMSRLKGQFVALQRRMMESELAYKTKLQNAEYEMQSLQVQNGHHRRKIQELMGELAHQRNNIDFGKLNRSLQLSQLKCKDLERELQHAQNRNSELSQQLRSAQERQRRYSESSSHTDPPKKQVQKERKHIHQKLSVQSSRDIKPPVNKSSQNVEKQQSTLYQQLVRQRQAVRRIRTDFQRRWSDKPLPVVQPYHPSTLVSRIPS